MHVQSKWTGVGGAVLLVALAGFVPACDDESSAKTNHACTTEPPSEAPDPGKMLSYTRLLRRTKLTLTGQPPSTEEYDAIVQAADDTEREAILQSTIDAALDSVDFYQEMVSYGHELIHNPQFNRGGSNEIYWVGDLSAHLYTCDAGTLHAGAYGVFSNYPQLGDPKALCDDPAAPIADVEPWWAAGTMVKAIGRAGNPTAEHNGRDCGVTSVSLYDNTFDDDPNNPGCGCGPNLIYCIPVSAFQPLDHNKNDDERSQRRQAWDEPARFFAHLAYYDRPLSDLVLGNYSVAPMYLQAMYARAGRRLTHNANLDKVAFWHPSNWTATADPAHDAKDPLAWREFVVETLNPTLLALSPNAERSGSEDRTSAFDPRKDSGQPNGVGAAGVLTMPGVLSGFARERVRGARFLETFACKRFVPPPADVQFNAYLRDPATEGVCQHCHAVVDPASIHFKRWGFGGYNNEPIMAGIGDWQWPQNPYADPWRRWDENFLPNTRITPVTEAELQANPLARFIDFLPPDQTLFGLTSDGTIGPLGFGKLLVKSGEFDHCMVRRLYQKFIGREVDAGSEAPLVNDLVAEFIAQGRALRPFVRYLLETEQFRRGL